MSKALNDVELSALAALVHADAVNIEAHNRRMEAVGMHSDYGNLRYVTDCDSYKALDAELRRREAFAESVDPVQPGPLVETPHRRSE